LSTNGKLTSLNDELASLNEEMGRTNSDLTNLLASIELPMLILDVGRRIRRCNATARCIFDIPPTEVGRPFLDDITSNLEVSDLGARVAEVIESDTMREAEVQDRCGRWYRMEIRPYRAADDKVDGATLSLVDIDTLKQHLGEAQRARTEAELANRAKDEFLAVLSHEIRTPLSSTLIQAQLLTQGNLDAAAVRRAGEAVERGTRLQVKLLDDLLDVSRIIAGTLKVEAGTVDLHAVIKAALEGVTTPAERKGITIAVALDEAIRTVPGDATRLQQVVSNVLVNAIKFSEVGGKVTVALERVDGRGRIQVSDGGCGIDPAFLPHVFERFTREDGTTVRRHGGLGLGLAISRYLVEAHGGTIVAESTGKGRGATFSVSLPLAHADGVTPEKAVADSSTSLMALPMVPSMSGLRVLVVDDDAGSRDAFSDVLRKMGAEVRGADSAAEGMKIFQAFHPDLLFCDLAMPGEDGYSLIRKVRALGVASGGDIPAFAVTAFASEADRRQALAAGFQKHVAKPVEINVLLQAVVAATRGRKALSPA
jgi:two-component system CheB/CheR fusion protein